MTLAAHDGRRVQGSIAASFGVHAAMFGLYLAMAASKPAQEIRLHEIEYMDLKPAPVAAPAQSAPAAQLPPRGLKDFLRMALPKLNQPSASQPQEARFEEKTMRELPSQRSQTLVDRGQLQRAESTMKLDAKLERSAGPAANLGEIANERRAPDSSALAAVAPDKAIDIGAVGRRAVRVAGPAIDISNSGPARGGASMKDFPTGGSAKGAPTGPAMAAPSGIDLKEGAPVRRGGGGGMPSIGFSKGGSGGISLAERPATRAASAALPAAAAPAAPKPAAEMAQASNSKKAMEITGPLAGRKVLSVVMPAYPDWAREKGVQADVMIRFFVGPDGRVTGRMFIERTSGYKELDDLCKEALEKILFAPLPPGSKEDQWGIITFRFRLT